jgi:hypothetical protein
VDPNVVAWLRAGEPPADRPFGDQEGRPRRLAVLLAAAVLPWVVVAALAWSAATGEPGGPAPPEGHAAPVQEHPAAAPAPPLSTPPPAGHPELDPAVAAHAVTAVRLHTAADGAVRRYVDLAVAERAETVGEIVVVTVLAVVLEGDAEQWQTTRRARFGVPLRLVDGLPVPLADPWPLADADGETASEMRWRSMDDPAAAQQILLALEREGFSHLGEVAVEEAPAAPGVLRAVVEARAPRSAEAAVHVVWLRDGPPMSVLGSLRHPEAEVP